jgi:hypothetical protein
MPKKQKIDSFSSFEDFDAAFDKWYHDAWLFDPYDVPDISSNHMERLKVLLLKAWEDSYNLGRKDAKSEQAIESAEAEWFHS